MAISYGHTCGMSKSVAAGEFKNSCLKLMDTVSKTGVPITVTKRGRPLVRIVPIADAAATRSLRGAIVHEADDIFSTGEVWDAES